MILAKVTGTVVTTFSHADYKHRRLLVCEPLYLDGDSSGKDFIALDNTQAGIGDTVLVLNEGSGARQVMQNKSACVISIIIGIVDAVHVAET